MHTHKFGNWLINFNSDFSGDLEITQYHSSKVDGMADEVIQEISMPFEIIEEIVALKARRDRGNAVADSLPRKNEMLDELKKINFTLREIAEFLNKPL